MFSGLSPSDRRSTRRQIAGVALACGIVAVGCGGDEKSPGTGSDPITIRGTEQLRWDQPGPSAAQVRQYQYRLYIGSDPRMLSSVTCGNTAGSVGYPCSAQLPGLPNGTHALRLMAIDNGVESERSTILTVIVDSSR
jgi:hypothetical protein